MIRVCIGTSDRFDKVAPVMAYCLVKNHGGMEDLTLTFMNPEDMGVNPHGCTGFTNMRFAVPEVCAYQGYAIYLDVDMFVLADIGELMEYAQVGKWVCLRDGSNEVSVIDCRAFEDLPPAAHLPNYKKHQLQAKVADREVRAIPLEWNCEDRVYPGAKLLHFTDLKTQPWFADHPDPEARAIWDDLHRQVYEI